MPHEYVAADWNTYRTPADKSLSQKSLVGQRPSEKSADKANNRGDSAGRILAPGEQSQQALQRADSRGVFGIGSMPANQLEDSASEGIAVNLALSAMVRAMVISAGDLDEHRYITFKRSVDTALDVGPWRISPRAQRLLYGIASLTKPSFLMAADCGSGLGLIFASGPAIGSKPVYAATDMVGCELQLAEAARAERNVRQVDHTGLVRIVPEESLQYLQKLDKPIDMLLLGNGENPAINYTRQYLPILKAALPHMRRGSIVIAQGSMSASVQLRDYLAFVRNSNNMPLSMNIVIDPMGFEVSMS